MVVTNGIDDGWWFSIFDVDIDRHVLSSKIPLKLLPQNLKAI